MVHPTSIILIAICASMVLAAPTFTEWEKYKIVHDKNYESDEETSRHQIWQGNMQRIKQHNNEADQGQHSYRLAPNKYSDLSAEEFRKVMNGYRPNLKPKAHRGDVVNAAFATTTRATTKPSTTTKASTKLSTTTKTSTKSSTTPSTTTKAPTTTTTTTTSTTPASAGLPASVDWRTQGYVTPIKDQGQCGSCWSFSATGALEGQHFKKTGSLVSLSEQNLIDCDRNDGGCNGGDMDLAFSYIKSNKGIDTEASYPYQAIDGSCRFNAANVGATDNDYVDIQMYNETALQIAVATIGPISVAIDASWDSFQFYSSGVYNEPSCSSEQLDHGVLVVGYGTLNSVDYWLVKNSWGTSWGDQGYIMMKRNANNQCGITTSASYPLV